MFFGLIVVIGFCIFEVFVFRFDDILFDGVLYIWEIKFCKSCLVLLYVIVIEVF